MASVWGDRLVAWGACELVFNSSSFRKNAYEKEERKEREKKKKQEVQCIPKK
jgi:hypothetical protein